jgi:hypothetical protein
MLNNFHILHSHWHYMTHSQVPGWTHLRVHQSVVAESWDSEGAPNFQHYKRVEGRARSPGIRLGRRISRSSLNLHSKQTTKWLVHIRSTTPLGVGTSHGQFGPQDTPRPGLGRCHHHPPYSILCATPPHLHSNGTFSRDSQVGVSKLSRNYPGWSPETLGAHNSWLQSLIATRSKPKL